MGTANTKIRCRRFRFRYCRKRPAAMTLLNDDDGLGKKEQEMEEFTHLMYAIEKTAWKSSFSAPVAKRLETGAKVLDAGCGNGTWILEQANNYPASEFIGLDKTSSIFPSQIRPMNVYFMRGNLLTRLPFDDDSFDYVRMSNMLMVFNKDNFEKAITELVRILKPGGYIELSEFEHSPEEGGPYFAMFGEEFKLKAQCEKHGERSFQPSESLPDLLSHTYVLTSIHKAHQRLLVGGRGGRLGMALYEMINMCFGVIHDELLMSKWALNKEEYMEIVAALLEETNERESWVNCYRHWGRKIVGRCDGIGMGGCIM